MDYVASSSSQKHLQIQPRTIVTFLVLAIIGLTTYIALTLRMIETSTFEIWAVYLIFPILLLVSLPVLARQARRENDRRLLWLLVAALLIKLIVGTFFRYYNTVEINGGTDSNKYHDAGVSLYEQFREGDFDSGLPSLSGTDFIRFATGLVYAVTGPSRPGGFLVFSWLAFWGLFYFYRAFVLAVPAGRSRTYARLIFFLPTNLFWPSSLGKEAWMMFAMGIAVFGVARLLTGNVWRGLAIACLGGWLAALVRPYMTGILILALGFAFVVKRRPVQVRKSSGMARLLAVAVLVVLAVILAGRTEQFLNERDVPIEAGVTDALTDVSTRSTHGGSTFVPTVLTSPAQAPVAVVTVLFRPFVTEAHTSRAMVSAIEGVFLFLLTVFRFPRMIAAIRKARHQPYIAFAIAYAGMFVFAFSSFANFGNLVRQRTLLFPLFLVMLCIPARTKAESGKPKPERQLRPWQPSAQSR